jgi:hypothetical protein
MWLEEPLETGKTSAERVKRWGFVTLIVGYGVAVLIGITFFANGTAFLPLLSTLTGSAVSFGVVSFLGVYKRQSSDQASGRFLLEGGRDSIVAACQMAMKAIGARLTSLDLESDDSGVIKGRRGAQQWLNVQMTKAGEDRYWIQIELHTSQPTKASFATNADYLRRFIERMTGVRLHEAGVPPAKEPSAAPGAPAFSGNQPVANSQEGPVTETTVNHT